METQTHHEHLGSLAVVDTWHAILVLEEEISFPSLEDPLHVAAQPALLSHEIPLCNTDPVLLVQSGS